jgi:hypothetical protein
VFPSLYQVNDPQLVGLAIALGFVLQDVISLLDLKKKLAGLKPVFQRGIFKLTLT